MFVRWYYSSFMLLALVVFLVVRHFIPRPARLRALPWRQRLFLVLAGFIGGALGGKLPFALGSNESVLSVLAWLQDGKTITTGLAGAYLAAELAKLALGIQVKTGDTFALPLALAMAVGRWGCYFNGCCYGVATDLPWGVDFGDGVLRHPTQIYESLFHFSMAAVLLWLMCHHAFRYQLLKFYLIAYCGYRFLTEFIRPEPAIAMGLTFYQWVAVVFASMLVVQWWYDRRLAGQDELISEQTTPEIAAYSDRAAARRYPYDRMPGNHQDAESRPAASSPRH
jgi:prolipoprotein diacylglyceryltransferase